MNDTTWLLLVVSLPTAQASARMRLWRATKTVGAVALRDGAYLLPGTMPCRDALQAQAADVRNAGGDAWLMQVAPLDAAETAQWVRLFDRTADYAALLEDTRAAQRAPSPQATRAMAALWRRHAQIVQADHFPGEAQQQCTAALAALQDALTRRDSPDEPHALRGRGIERLDTAQFQGRTWATRARPWVDRLATAWLVRRCIDADASFRWLKDPAKCRASWLGFDFDGARFSHSDGRVTFETMLASFGLDADPVLRRIGALVHILDVGGVPVAEASGIEAALGGLREHLPDDDQLLDAACAVFDGLRRAYAETR
jgi:hypothetical protein